ncbi:MAG TPA: (d)CMP kinase [Saprospiraceae bacterium]|nr:(d)CMP kinase [Saprospiraceae bacterium]
MKDIAIAIDGLSSCGKSTLARDLAEALDYMYVDSGAMYRAVTLYLLENELDYENIATVEEALAEISISFSKDPDRPGILLNGRHVEKEIRKKRVTENVSPVATISEVRRFLVKQQQKLGENKAIVMDGRDIGTVVFPNAELKLFLKADLETRTSRRYKELLGRGIEFSREEVQKNLGDRDHIDSTREDSPLTVASDAIVVDNTNINCDEQLQMCLALAQYRIDHPRSHP